MVCNYSRTFYPHGPLEFELSECRDVSNCFNFATHVRKYFPVFTRIPVYGCYFGQLRRSQVVKSNSPIPVQNNGSIARITSAVRKKRGQCIFRRRRTIRWATIKSCRCPETNVSRPSKKSVTTVRRGGQETGSDVDGWLPVGARMKTKSGFHLTGFTRET